MNVRALIEDARDRGAIPAGVAVQVLEAIEDRRWCSYHRKPHHADRFPPSGGNMCTEGSTLYQRERRSKMKGG